MASGFGATFLRFIQMCAAKEMYPVGLTPAHEEDPEHWKRNENSLLLVNNNPGNQNIRAGRVAKPDVHRSHVGNW